MCRTLVVDDDADCADSLCLLLRLAGHEAAAAYSGAEALALAESFRPRLVFVDLAMPRMGGVELAGRLRALPCMAGARLVALSARHDGAELAAGAGLDASLLKPAEPGEICRIAGAAYLE